MASFLRFEPIIYPLWRRQVPRWARPLSDALLKRSYPVQADRQPPDSPQAMVDYLLHWGIMDDDAGSLAATLREGPISIETASPAATAQPYSGGRVRLPAQWDATERVLLSWPVLYPLMWPMHAAMTEAISHAATAELLVPTAMWARAVQAYLSQRGQADMTRVRFTVLRTDDIWIRDYGPIVGLDEAGQQVALNAIYDPLPLYPQADDNAMPGRWAAHRGLPLRELALHTEGGNLWSDGAGTLIMSEQIYYSNPDHTPQSLLAYLHSLITFDKLIITPRLRLEETGHVDLLAKLVSADTVLVSAATSRSTGGALRDARRIFQQETNAAGDRYQILELPTPPLYLNWFVYTIRRSYTNALTVNGRVLVPTFGVPEDEIALHTYEQALPDSQIIPIDSRVGINGGGAVHCMTREVPAAQPTGGQTL